MFIRTLFCPKVSKFSHLFSSPTHTLLDRNLVSTPQLTVGDETHPDDRAETQKRVLLFDLSRLILREHLAGSGVM